MSNLIVCDSRERKNKKILEYFDSVGQDYIVSKLDAGDYMVYKDYTTIIDKKDGLLELAGNLCNTTEHQRILREVQRAKELKCTNFIFLIQDNSIKTIDDIQKWTSPHTKVKGSTLLKIMISMKKKYGVRFIIVRRGDIGAKIIELLNAH